MNVYMLIACLAVIFLMPLLLWKRFSHSHIGGKDIPMALTWVALALRFFAELIHDAVYYIATDGYLLSLTSESPYWEIYSLSSNACHYVESAAWFFVIVAVAIDALTYRLNVQ